MSNFVEFCNQITPLTKEAMEDLASKIKYKSFKKGKTINREGQVCKQFYYIEKGLAKHYYYNKGRVFILRFFAEDNVFTVISSYLHGAPAEFTTVALEDMDTSYITYDDLEQLCRRHHCMETFVRIIFANASLLNLQRVKELFDQDATELYKSFTKENAHLLERISLGDIASYIGISQVTLSRIRAK